MCVCVCVCACVYAAYIHNYALLFSAASQTEESVEEGDADS